MPRDAISGKRSRADDAVESLPSARPRLDSVSSVLAHIAASTSWQELFEVGDDGAADDGASDLHTRARAVRNRLVRVAHPDRCTSSDTRLEAQRATANLNRLWDEACRHFAPSGGSSGGNDGPCGAQLGTWCAGLLPSPLTPAAELGGSLELLARASRIEGNRPPAMLEVSSLCEKRSGPIRLSVLRDGSCTLAWPTLPMPTTLCNLPSMPPTTSMRLQLCSVQSWALTWATVTWTRSAAADSFLWPQIGAYRRRWLPNASARTSHS